MVRPTGNRSCKNSKTSNPLRCTTLFEPNRQSPHGPDSHCGACSKVFKVCIHTRTMWFLLHGLQLDTNC